MKITNKRNKPSLTYSLTSFYICENCLIVDKDNQRMDVGHVCPICKAPNQDGAIAYFHSGISVIIRTIENVYQFELKDENDHKSIVSVLFCTLGEVLLDNFLVRKMNSMGLSTQIQDRILEDNLFIKQRINKVFPALTNTKWKDAIKGITSNKGTNYQNVIDFYLDVYEKRNAFLHRGDKYAITREIPDKCIEHLPPLVDMFVALHNRYIYHHNNLKS